jgi:hypothetical protein
MNERIKELAEQAKKYARDYVAECKHYGHYIEYNEYELQFEQKFAELIKQAIYDQVKEELVSDEDIDKCSPLEKEYLKGNNGGVVDALFVIKNFGKDVEL